MISPLTNERKYGDVSTEDFTTLGVTVVQNSSDITTANTQIAANAAKPSSSQVDSQIDVKNTTQMTQLYTKTETDAALALKGSAAQLATVTAYANTLPTLSTVNNVLNARFILQDGSNFVTYGAKSDVTANTAAITAAASTYATQSALATVTASAATNATNISAAQTALGTVTASAATNATNISATQTALGTVTASAATNATNITATQVEVVLLQSAVTQNSAQGNTSATTLAGVVAGTQALSAVDVQGNLTTTGTAIIGSSLQTTDLTATGRVLSSSWGAFGSIPLNPQTGDLSSLNLSSTNVYCSGTLTVNGQAVTGGASAASAGDVLKITRTEIANGNIFIATNGSFTTITSVWHTPSDASSYLNVDFVGVWTINAPSGNDDGQWKLSLEVDNATIGSTTFKCLGNRESGSTSPIWGQYTNSSTSAKQIVFMANRRTAPIKGCF